MGACASRPLAAACAATQNASALARVGSAGSDGLVGPETARSRLAGRFCRPCSVQHAGLESQGPTCWLAPAWLGSAPGRGPARASAPGSGATALGLNPFTPPAKGGVKAGPNHLLGAGLVGPLAPGHVATRSSATAPAGWTGAAGARAKRCGTSSSSTSCSRTSLRVEVQVQMLPDAYFSGLLPSQEQLQQPSMMMATMVQQMVTTQTTQLMPLNFSNSSISSINNSNCSSSNSSQPAAAAVAATRGIRSCCRVLGRSNVSSGRSGGAVAASTSSTGRNDALRVPRRRRELAAPLLSYLYHAHRDSLCLR